jgi:hypothetical protein
VFRATAAGAASQTAGGELLSGIEEAELAGAILFALTRRHQVRAARERPFAQGRVEERLRDIMAK